MALKPTHWLIATILVCCTIAVVFLPPAVGRNRFSTRQRQLNFLRSEVLSAHRDLRVLEQRDSLMAILSSTRPTDSGGYFLVDPGLPDAERKLLVGGVAELLPKPAGARSTSRYVLAVIVDSVETLGSLGERKRRWSDLVYFLPEGTDSRSCLSILRLGRDDMRRFERGVATNPFARPALLGLCAYYAAFGKPGRDVGAWLLGDGYTMAQLPEWTLGGRVRHVGTSRVYDYWFQPYYYTMLACAAGHRSCVDLVGSGKSLKTTSPIYSGLSFYRKNTVFHPLGPQAGYILSDLMLDIGSEKFGRFWSSDLPVERAFAEAAGRSLDDWIREWVVRTYSLPRRYGPSLPLGTYAMSLLIATVFVGGSCVLAGRRSAS